MTPGTEINHSLLSSADIEILDNWNDTKSDYPAIPVTVLFSNAAKKFRGKVAVQFNGESLNYGELQIQSNQFANLLITNGINPRDRIAICIERSMEMIIALLGILKCGACYIPLDPKFPSERLQFMLDDSKAALFITSETAGNQINTKVKKLLIEQLKEDLSAISASDPLVLIENTWAAYILYTSGSTGKPKGVEVLHSNLVNFLTSMQKSPGIEEDDKLLAITTISFDIAGLELYLPLISGAELHIADDYAIKDWRKLQKLLENGITILQATPSTWRMLIDSEWPGNGNLKVLCGGEPLTRKLADDLLQKCRSLWNMYGPTETTIWSTLKHIVPGTEQITIGRPIDNTQIYILNEQLERVAIGQVGEICIAGDGVALGYINREELTAEKFIDNNFCNSATNKIYRTGDLGQFNSDGELVCLGRIDHQVKIRGFRIELGEITQQLLTLSGVKDAIVVALESKSTFKYLCAYVQVQNPIQGDAKSTIANWKQALSKNLPDYMMPSEIVVLNSFPLTPNGKIDRNALPVPDFGGEYCAPENELEETIANIWAEALQYDRIGTNDNFFELGGNSVIAVQVMNRIEKTTGVSLSLATLFSYSTVKALAGIIENDQAAIQGAYNSLVPVKAGGTKVPLFIVHGGGLNVLFFNSIAREMDPEQPVYGLQPKGLDGKESPLENIQDIAEHYITQIGNKYPDGPYLLAGYSMGGMIAFEMAKQLKEKGQKVGILIMLDTSAEIADWHVSIRDQLPKKFHLFMSKLNFLLFTIFRFPRHTFNYRKKIFLERILKLAKLSPAVNESKKNKRISDAFEKAFKKYHMTPYEGEINIIKAKIPTYFRPDFKYLGWKELAIQGLKIHEVDGDHTSMLLPPNNANCAAILQKCLDDVTK